MAVQDQRKSYQANQSPEETEVECPVCLNILCDPKLAACCGRSICAACNDQIESGKKSCPLCNLTTKLVDDKHLKQPLGGISVHCTYKEQGCKCTGGLREAVKNHHNQQSTSYRRSTDWMSISEGSL